MESEYDEACFQKLFELLRGDLASPYSLTFIASGKGGGGSCDAVMELVRGLRAAGNDSVWGIVDRDSRGGVPDWIVYNSSRYALENLVLDALGVALFLLRSQILTAEELGLDGGTRHFEVVPEFAQKLIDVVVAQVSTGEDDVHPVEVLYQGGFSGRVPEFWLQTKGHDLEERIVQAFPALKREKQALKLRIIQHAYGDVPASIPLEAKNLFAELLRA